MKRHAPPKMTKAGNRTAAFMAITLCPLDMLNAERIRSIAATSGISVAQIEGMIADRREREGSSAA